MPFGYSITFTNRQAGQVLRWNPDTDELSVIAGNTSGPQRIREFGDVYGLALDASGGLLIADKHRAFLQRHKGTVLEPFAHRDVDGHRRALPSSARGYHPRLNGPAGLFMRPSGVLLVSFFDSNVIYAIHPDGRLEHVLGRIGNVPYTFGEIRASVPASEGREIPIYNPASLVERSDGTLYFIERGWQAVREYHPARGLRHVFLRATTKLPTPRPLQVALDGYRPWKPGVVALDGAGRLYVTDLGLGCVWGVDEQAGLLRRIMDSPRGGKPAAIAFGPDGTAWILDAARGCLEGYSPTPNGLWNKLSVRRDLGAPSMLGAADHAAALLVG